MTVMNGDINLNTVIKGQIIVLNSHAIVNGHIIFEKPVNF